MFQTSKLYLENLNATEEIVVNQGGTSSGKTYSILQTLFSIAISHPHKIITVVAQDIPNIKAGALRDALEIHSTSDQLKSLVTNYNKSDRIFEFSSGSIMEFKSFTDSQDAKSGKRDYLFVNEANGVSYDIYSELHLRTKERTFIDYNPNFEFWVHEKILPEPNVKFLITDHRHNPFLSQKMHDKIESLKDRDEELWRVYARGLTGKIEGLILRNWGRVTDFPKDAELIGYGLDFGFTNDPTALTEVRKQNGSLFAKVLIYETGLTNDMIDERMKEMEIEHEWIIADSAEPKSIEELRRFGWKIEGANKGKDSVVNSIDILKRYPLFIVSSPQAEKELRSYKWKVDKTTGKTLNEPVGVLDHFIASLRYLALNRLSNNNSGEYFII